MAAFAPASAPRLSSRQVDALADLATAGAGIGVSIAREVRAGREARRRAAQGGRRRRAPAPAPALPAPPPAPVPWGPILAVVAAVGLAVALARRPSPLRKARKGGAP